MDEEEDVDINFSVFLIIIRSIESRTLILYCLNEKIKNLSITFCEVGCIEVSNYASMYDLTGSFFFFYSQIVEKKQKASKPSAYIHNA